MTAAEAIAALAPILGGGTLGAFATAYFGYRTQALKTRDKVEETAGLGPVKAADAELLASALSLLSGAISRSNLIREFEIEIAGRSDQFEKYVEEREMEQTLAVFRAERTLAERARR